ncbi:MAG: LysR family transcriptional regulator [Mycobacterium leprae]
MDLEGLETFLTVARMRSINKAAEALFLAQSTVTHRVQRLEKELGTALFERNAGGVELTQEGRRFLPLATSIGEQLRSFSQTAQERRSLTLVAGRAFLAYDLPELLGEFRRRQPGFTCYVRSTLYEESVHALLTGTGDLAILGAEVYHPALCQVALPADRIMLVMAPRHPWAAGFPGFGAWGDQELVAFGNNSYPFRQRVDRFLAERGVFPQISMEMDSVQATQRMVMQDLGVAFLPWRTVREAVENGRLVALDVADGRFTRPTVLVYPRARENDATLQEFVALIVERYSQL